MFFWLDINKNSSEDQCERQFDSSESPWVYVEMILLAYNKKIDFENEENVFFAMIRN